MTHPDPGALLKLADEIERACKAPHYEARLGTIEGKMVVAALLQAASQGSAGGEQSEVRSGEDLTCDFAQSLPGGKLDDSTYEKIETALDRADAPCMKDGKWLSLHERIAALALPHQGAEKECACVKPGGDPLGNCEVCDPPAQAAPEPYGWHAAGNGLFTTDPRCAEVWRGHMGLKVTPVYTASSVPSAENATPPGTGGPGSVAADQPAANAPATSISSTQSGGEA